MFGFLLDTADKFDILNDETYVDMTVAQYTYINSSKHEVFIHSTCKHNYNTVREVHERSLSTNKSKFGKSVCWLLSWRKWKLRSIYDQNQII